KQGGKHCHETHQPHVHAEKIGHAGTDAHCDSRLVVAVKAAMTDGSLEALFPGIHVFFLHSGACSSRIVSSALIRLSMRLASCQTSSSIFSSSPESLLCCFIFEV